MSDSLDLKKYSPEIQSLLESLYEQFRICVQSRKEAEDKVKIFTELESRIDKMHETITGQSIYNANWQEPLIVNSPSSLDTPNRFWRAPGFEGWKSFVLKYLNEVNEFTSLGEMIAMTEETDVLERKALRSAISNALTTNLEDGVVVALKTKVVTGRFYGLKSFVDEFDLVKDEYVVRLKQKLRLKEMSFRLMHSPATREDL